MQTEKHSTIQVTSFQKIVAITLIVSPIIQTYGWGPYNFSFIAILILSLIHIFKRGISNNKVPKTLVLYFLLWYISHLLTLTSISEILHLGLIRLLLSLFLFFDCLHLKYFIITYRKVAVVCIVFFFCQEILYYLTGARIPGVVTFLPNSLVEDAASFVSIMATEERSSSFFSEPAHFVQFLLPLLTTELFAFDRINWKNVFAVALTLLALQSGNAILGLTIIAISYIICLLLSKKLSIAYKSVATLFIIVFGVFFTVLYMRTEQGRKLLARTETVTSTTIDESEFVSSGFIRIWRGYFVFSEYSSFYKIIGNANSNYVEEKINQSDVRMFFGENERYMNTVQQILINTGFVGLFIFLLFLYQEWKKTNTCGRVALVLLLGLSFVSYLFFSSAMIICFLMANQMPRNTILNSNTINQYKFCRL